MLTFNACRVAVFIVLGAALVAAPVGAQGIAESFNELRLLVRPGDTVTVTGETGAETTGRITDVSTAGLTLQIGRRNLTFREPSVRSIRQRYSDSVGNGARWGFGAGAALAGLALLYFDANIGPGESALLVGVYGGLGAGIGVGVDALNRSTRVIYRPPAGGGRLDLRVSPLLTRTQTGARMTLGF